MRVVITGMGAVSCLGIGLEEITASLKEGRSGIVSCPERVERGFRSPLTGKIRGFEPRRYVNRKEVKSMGEPARYAVAAALEAVANAGLRRGDFSSPRCGLVVGNDSTARPAVEAVDSVRANGCTRLIGSGTILQVMNSTVSMNLGTFFGVLGASWTVGAACASGAHAIGQGMMLIKSGLQDRVLCGGAQEINWEAMSSFDALGAFAKASGPPEAASRPFSADRTGLVPSGGAAMLVLESLESASARGAPVVAEVRGYGFSCDGGHLTSPGGDGAVSSMSQCLSQAGMNAGEVDYINAHATGTPAGDRVEGLAILRVFGDDPPPVSSTKSMTGHECWMAGASEIIYSALMMRDHFIAPNINLSEVDPALGRLPVVTRTRAARVRSVLSNSFGFGGTNASLLISQIKGTK